MLGQPAADTFMIGLASPSIKCFALYLTHLHFPPPSASCSTRTYPSSNMPHAPEVRKRKSVEAIPKSTYRDLAAKNPNFTESLYSIVHTPLMHADPLYSADVLNAGNPSKIPSTESDVTVIGAGIHGLIYSIHARLMPSSDELKISVFEKTAKPLHKARRKFKRKPPTPLSATHAPILRSANLHCPCSVCG